MKHLQPKLWVRIVAGWRLLNAKYTPQGILIVDTKNNERTN